MDRESERFSTLELSAVREMANIGLGHAMTALATLTGRSFNMEVPGVCQLSLDEVITHFGDGVVMAVYMPIDGEMGGQTAFVFPWETGQAMLSLMLGSAPDSPDDLDELMASAMLEIGNIINSSFLTAISDMSGLKLYATPPLVSIDECASIVSSIVAEAELSEYVALAIETQIFSTEVPHMTGLFLCIPTVDGLSHLLERLGVRGAA